MIANNLNSISFKITDRKIKFVDQIRDNHNDSGLSRFNKCMNIWQIMVHKSLIFCYVVIYYYFAPLFVIMMVFSAPKDPKTKPEIQTCENLYILLKFIYPDKDIPKCQCNWCLDEY